jgi:predicted MFS family arabinose efflux permease
LPEDRDPLAVAAGLVTGGLLTWNVANVGAVADPLADAYGVSLPAIGLLTTALLVTQFASQFPAGAAADRRGPRAVALAAIAAAVAGNAILLATDVYAVALAGRLIVGVGAGAGFLSGLDLVRAGGGGPVARGAYGGATMAGGGLALMIVPALADATSWRVAYASGLVLAVAAAIPVALTRPLPLAGGAPTTVLRDRRLLPLGALQAATFGLAVVAGVWVVPLLERRGAGSVLAGLAGGMILFAGVLTRPLGGVLERRGMAGRHLAALGIAGCAAGAATLAAGGPLLVSAAAALLLGLGAGLPFATIFTATHRGWPRAPGSAVAVVNGCAVLAILVLTPLAGLAFSAPAEGGIAFAIIAGLALLALPAIAHARLDSR